MRGQVTIELLAAMAFLLLLSVVLLSYVFFRDGERVDLQRQLEEKTLCESVSAVIQSFSASHSLGSTRLRLDRNIQIQGGYITVGNHYCTYFGRAENQDLNMGNVTVRTDANGVVVFEQ